MSDRRRSSIVLLIVAALIGASIWAVTSHKTVLGLDLQGGVQLVYKAEPTAQQAVDPDSMQRSIDLMQQRVNEFGVSEAELFRSGENQIEVNLPGVKDAEQAARQVGSTAQLFFYDWEANILDDKCKTNPEQNARAKTTITGIYKAVQQASKCTEVGVGKGADPLGEDSAGGKSVAAAKPRFYVFDKQKKAPFGDTVQSFQSRKDALDSLTPQEQKVAEVMEVPAGVLVLRDENTSTDPNAKAPDRWWVIQDRPGLTGTDIKNPEQSF